MSAFAHVQSNSVKNSLRLNHFDSEQFKAEYWQQKPGVFPAVFKNFDDPITKDELAGLALEPGVDSRIISCNRGVWDLKHGPFEDYASLGSSHWTLLVQAVNEHYPPTRFLLNYFDWLPDWRIDDLMVSYATPQGGVGAHIDQYDVFIIQGQGTRRWQVGHPEGLKTIQPHPELKQVSGMQPFIDVELQTGDMLYIPAGFPHQGVSIGESLSFSVGFRAPSQAELLAAIADKALDESKLNTRYQDTKESLIAQATKPSYFLPRAAIQNLQKLLIQAIEDKAFFDSFAAAFLSQNPRPPLQFWPDQEITAANLQAWLEQHKEWLLVPGIRWVTTQSTELKREQVVFHGQAFNADSRSYTLLQALKYQESLSSRELIEACIASPTTKTWVLWLINEGYLVGSSELEIDDSEE